MSKAITIVRAEHSSENPYFLLARETAQDERLSFEARGMLAYLLSKPDGWKITVADLCQQCGRTRVYRILKELREAKYIEYERKSGGRGKWEHLYKIHELSCVDFTDMKSTDVKSTDVKNPDVLDSTESLEITEDRKERGGTRESGKRSDPMADAATPQYTIYLDAWRDAHPDPKPIALRGRKRDEAIEDAKELQLMGCTPDDWAAFVKSRIKNGKSTTWHFMVQDVHDFLSRQRSKPVQVTRIEGSVVYDEATNTTMVWDIAAQKWIYTEGRAS